MLHPRSEVSEIGQGAPRSDDRRQTPREESFGHVWLSGVGDAAAAPCRCIDVSKTGIRLRAPLGYGIREGREYELCSHPPEAAGALLGLVVRRRVTVVRSAVHLGPDGDALDVGMTFLPREWTPLGSA